MPLQSVLWIRIRTGSRFNGFPWIRIQESKNGPEKYKSAGCSLLRAEGFSCSLDVVYGGLGISKLPQFLIKKINKNIVSCDGVVVRLPPLWF
jgi:hypothetical protein